MAGVSTHPGQMQFTQNKGRAATVRLNPAHSLSASVIIYVGNHNRHPFTRQLRCDYTTDPSTSARYDGNCVLHVSSYLISYKSDSFIQPVVIP